MEEVLPSTTPCLTCLGDAGSGVSVPSTRRTVPPLQPSGVCLDEPRFIIVSETVLPNGEEMDGTGLSCKGEGAARVLHLGQCRHVLGELPAGRGNTLLA